MLNADRLRALREDAAGPRRRAPDRLRRALRGHAPAPGAQRARGPRARGAVRLACGGAWASPRRRSRPRRARGAAPRRTAAARRRTTAAPEGSVTTVVRREALDQRPRDSGIDRCHEPDPERGQPRGEERHRQLRPAAAAEHVGHAVQHLAVGEDVGTADLHLAARGLRDLAAPARGRRARRRSRSAASAS